MKQGGKCIMTSEGMDAPVQVYLLITSNAADINFMQCSVCLCCFRFKNLAFLCKLTKKHNNNRTSASPYLASGFAIVVRNVDP